MKILFVINSFYTTGNGLAASARRTVRALRNAGEDVRILSGANPDSEGIQPDYTVPGVELPGIFGKLVREEGYAFSAPDESVIREAVAWADVIHNEEPFPLQAYVCRIAEEMHVPCTCTYHIHPENIFASVGLEHSLVCNDAMMKLWCKHVFNHCAIIQSPSENAAQRLKAYHVKPEIRVISNGILPTPAPERNPERKTPPYVIICVGRFSKEKNQMLLLKAMEHAAYAKQIQLVFAGRGPEEDKLRKKGRELLEKGVLAYPPIFQFMDYDQLQKLSVNADLFVHCADIEVEGMSCMETVRNGLVPVIAQGKYTACSQFALSPESIYPCGDENILAERIDYWLYDDNRRKKEAEKYLSYTDRYNIDKSVKALQKMFHDAILK